MKGVARVRRVCDPPHPQADGVRVPVDRLWPRGLAKARAEVGEWPKAGDPVRGAAHVVPRGREPAEFRERYEAELAEPEAAAELSRLREPAAKGPVTLLTAVRDPASGHAAVLAELLST